MTADLAEEKRALRGTMRAAREALSPDERVSRTVAAVERLLELPAFAPVEGRVIAGYVAIGGELSPAGALAYVSDEGGTVSGAWHYATDEVPNFDEVLQAARALRH